MLAHKTAVRKILFRPYQVPKRSKSAPDKISKPAHQNKLLDLHYRMLGDQSRLVLYHQPTVLKINNY